MNEKLKRARGIITGIETGIQNKAIALLIKIRCAFAGFQSSLKLHHFHLHLERGLYIRPEILLVGCIFFCLYVDELVTG